MRPRRSAATCPRATSSTCTRLRPVSTNAGMRPVAAAMMIRPVGVGRTSKGPIVVAGLTMTAGSPCAAISRTRASAMILLRWEGALAPPLHDDARAPHVGGKNLAAVARPQAIVRRHMDEVTARRERRPDRGGVIDASFDDFDAERGEVIAPARGPHQRTHGRPFRYKLSHDGGADESACARHKHAVRHRTLSCCGFAFSG